jgi:ABC-type spermidine/putrescine transport system permease subunit I
MTATEATGHAIGRGGRRASAGWPRLANLPFVAPMAILVLLFFDLPLLLAFGWSIRDHKTHEFTLENYQEFFTSRIYIQIIWRTFFIAGIVTLSCAALAYPLAYWMSRLSPRRQLIAICCVVVPFWVSILVRTYAWIVVLGNGGIVNRSLQGFGLTERPVSFLYNEFGVTLGMVNVLLPFLVLPLYAAMLKFDMRLSQVAATLGAKDATIFWRVFFPVTFPALAAGMVLVFILSLGFFITPAILGGGKVPMVANAMDLMINRFSRWEMAAVVSVMLLAFTLTFYAFYQWLRART